MFGLNRKNEIENITVGDVLRDKQNKIIDVREINEYEHGHIPSAQNIPMMGLLMNAEQFLNKEETYYIVCQSGNRSHQVCKQLVKQGYHVVNVLGGTSEYIQNYAKK